MLTSKGFELWINALADRWFPLSGPAKTAYWHHLHERFDSDEQFAAVCIELFALEQKNYPSPNQFLETLRQFKAQEYRPRALPAAPENYTPPPWWHEHGILFGHFIRQGWRWIQHSPTDPTVFVLEMIDRGRSVIFRRGEQGWVSEDDGLNEMARNVLAAAEKEERTEPEPQVIAAQLHQLTGQRRGGPMSRALFPD